jgi:hypothetical protein
MKKYRLLKELPGIPVGSISEPAKEGENNISFHFPNSDEGYLGYLINTNKFPHWVEEVEEKEFTKTEVMEILREYQLYMEKYILYATNTNSGLFRPHMKANEWVKNSNNFKDRLLLFSERKIESQETPNASELPLRKSQPG